LRGATDVDCLKWNFQPFTFVRSTSERAIGFNLIGKELKWSAVSVCGIEHITIARRGFDSLCGYLFLNG